MRVLISVRSASEAVDAYRAGADIIDAKEPSRGPLGPVGSETLADILRVLPEDCEVSIALGDHADRRRVVEAVSSLKLRSSGVTYLKIGLTGAPILETAQSVLEAAVASTPTGGTGRMIAVGYADWRLAATIPPDVLCAAAAEAGCHGVLLDTYSKDGRTLLEWMAPPALESWISRAHRLGLIAGTAGSLGPAELESVASLAPDVIGFRGAACDGGREGRISGSRVAALVASARTLSGSVQGIPN